MKKLTNISPFLLLLVPVFMMMALTIAADGNVTAKDEARLKSAPAATVSKAMNKI